jgi:hypothetical protein
MNLWYINGIVERPWRRTRDDRPQVNYNAAAPAPAAGYPSAGPPPKPRFESRDLVDDRATDPEEKPIMDDAVRSHAMHVTHFPVVSGDECGALLPLQEACSVHEGIGVREQRVIAVADEVRRADQIVILGEDFTAKGARSDAREENRHLKDNGSTFNARHRADGLQFTKTLDAGPVHCSDWLPGGCAALPICNSVDLRWC